jgi:exopolysaccharide production protein ExoZ
LITILLGISALVIPSLFNNFEVHPTQIVESLLFIPFYNEDGNIRPILSMGWTLHYEVAFYLVTACCIAVNINKQNKALTAAVFITLLSIAISSFNAELKFSFLQLVAPLSIEFLFGATTAFIFTRYGQLISEGKSRILFALGCLGISSALLATNNEAEIGIGFPRLMHWGIPGALILISGLLLEPEIKKIVDKTKTISLLADASYSIYLIHGISFSVTYKIAYFVGIRNDAVLAAALLMGAIIVGTITHKRVEKPLQIWIATHIKK